MEYTLQTLRNNTVFNDRADALDFLNNFQHHMNGQPVCVRYYNGQQIESLFAVGLKDYDDGGVGHGSDYYHIIEGNTVQQVQANWNQTVDTEPDFIIGKPTIPDVHDSTITIQQNGDTIGEFTLNQDQPGTINIDTAQEQADWWESDIASPAFIQHKPNIPQVHDYTITIMQNGHDVGSFSLNQDYDDIIDLTDTAQVQSDWDQNDDTALDYIKNKPIVPGIPEDFAQWRTPAASEWTYLLYTRTASTIGSTADARFCKCGITLGENTTRYGLLIFPDVFELPASISSIENINSSGQDFDSNTFDLSQLEDLLAAKCVFLPAGGYRGGTVCSNVNSYCFYASTTQQSQTRTKYLFVSYNYCNGEQSDDKINGKCVRLISENANGYFSVAANTKVNIKESNLIYHCLNKQWSFHEHAYDIIGDDNANIDENYNGYIDLFGYGTSGWDSGAVAYQPWSSSQFNTDYLSYDLTGDYANADWGYAATDHTLAKVAFTGDYNDLSNKPTIPQPTAADENKLLSVDGNGDYVLVTIVNSENIAY